MTQYNFEYNDPRFPNELAKKAIRVGERDSEFTVELMPDIEDLLDVVEHRTKIEIGSEELRDDLNHRERSKIQQAAYFRKVYELCVEYQIIPFVGLLFDGNVVRHPEVTYQGWNCQVDWDLEPAKDKKFIALSDELHKNSTDPLNYVGKNWYSMKFNEIKGEEDIKKLAEVTKSLIEGGWRVTYLKGTLNPEVTYGDHGYSGGRTSYDASFSVHQGRMFLDVLFEIPEGFDVDGAVKNQDSLEDVFRELQVSVTSP